MKNSFLKISFILLLFSCSKKDDAVESLAVNEMSLYFNYGEVLVGDSLILMDETVRIEREADTASGTTGNLFRFYFEPLTLRILNDKDSNSFVGEYIFSRDEEIRTMAACVVFTDQWDIPDSHVQYPDYEMIHGTVQIDTLSDRYAEYPENAPGYWVHGYYQYFQEIHVRFFGAVVERDFTLKYGNEKIDTLLISGTFKGYSAYHDEDIYLSSQEN